MSLKQKFKKNQKCDLSKTVDRYRVMYESSQDALMTLEPPNWKFTSGNPAAIKMFRTKDEKEFISLSPGDLSPQFQPDGQKSSVKALKMINKAIRSGNAFFEWTHQRHRGECFFATVLLTRFKFCGRYILEATVRDISEQKIIEEKLKIKNFIFDHTLAANSIANINGIIIEVNQSFLDIWGFSNKKEVIGKPISYFLKNKKDTSLIVEALKKKGAWHGNYVAKKKDGSNFIAYGSAAKLTNEDGITIGFQSSVYDMTKENEAINLIKESQKRFEDVALSSYDWIWEVDVQGKFTYVSKGVKRSLGYSSEEILGKTPFDFMPKDEAERVKKIFKKLSKDKKKASNLENINIHKNGKKIILITNGVPFFDEAGVLKGYRGLNKDITIEKKIQEEKKINEEIFEEIFNYSPISIELYNAKGELEKINKATCEIFGLKNKDSVLGFKLFNDPNIPEDLKKYLKKGKMIQYESAFDFDKVKKSNLYDSNKKGIIYLSVVISPIKGGSEGYLVMINDITEKNNAQLEIKNKLEEMEKLNKIMIGRELKMVELKNKIKELKG